MGYFDRQAGKQVSDFPEWRRFFDALDGKNVNFRQSGLPTSTRTVGKSPALQSLAGGEQAEIDESNSERPAWARWRPGAEDRATDAISALENDPARMLGTGRAAALARQSGDITRGEHVRDAEALGQADVARYFAPGQRDLRQQQLWDKEREQQTLYPFSKSVIDAERARDVAGITGQSRVLAAGQTGDARRDSAALSALARAGTAPIFPGGEERAATTMGAILPNVPGQPAAAGGGKVFPAARLAQFATEKGFQSPEQARQYLEQVAGYRVQ